MLEKVPLLNTFFRTFNPVQICKACRVAVEEISFTISSCSFWDLILIATDVSLVPTAPMHSDIPRWILKESSPSWYQVQKHLSDDSK